MSRPEPTAQGTVFDLASIRAEIEGEEAYKREGHSARTLLRQGDMRVVFVVMRAGAKIAAHSAKETAQVHVVAGHARLGLPEKHVDLRAQQLLVMEPGLKHDVEAVTDTAFVLTLGWHAPA